MCLEVFGDRWSLLIVRDLMVRGYRTFKEFQTSGEGIATNILADRLQKLEAAGIINPEPEETDGRKINYRLTQKGIDLAPVLLDLLIWGARHEPADASWRERDSTPLIPRFDAGMARQLGRTQRHK
jgi:DNA-binding HxlR family transcriptional regulator